MATVGLAPEANMNLLEIRNMDHYFGGLRAIHRFSIAIEPKEIVGLIGPNGAGKTTIFNLITGFYRPTVGEILFDGLPIHGKRPFVITQAGISRTFQNIRLFGEMTVLENIKVAHHHTRQYGLFSALLSSRRFWKCEEEIENHCLELLSMFGLRERAHERADSLPYGDQRRLEIARALATNPRLLLLDEPAAGMNPREAESLLDTIHELRDQFDLTILLIEHQMRVVMGVCERIKVLDFGETIAEGTPDQIQKNEQVIRAYLGEEAIR